MTRAHGAAVLAAIADPSARFEITREVRSAGFEVWQAEGYDDAVALLHGSSRRLIVLVDPHMAPLLRFAVADRRLVHHHVYVAFNTPSAAHEASLTHLYPYLTVLTLAEPSPQDLSRALTCAVRLLTGEATDLRALALR